MVIQEAGLVLDFETVLLPAPDPPFPSSISTPHSSGLDGRGTLTGGRARVAAVADTFCLLCGLLGW